MIEQISMSVLDEKVDRPDLSIFNKRWMWENGRPDLHVEMLHIDVEISSILFYKAGVPVTKPLFC